MLLRIQSEQGAICIEIDEDSSIHDLYKKVYDSFRLISQDFVLSVNRNGLPDLEKNLHTKDLNFSEGERLFLVPISNVSLFDMAPKSVARTLSSNTESGTKINLPIKSNVLEDAVDQLLEVKTGRIERTRTQGCLHESNSMNQCLNCCALDPFDESYLTEQKIKYLSFHAYLRKIGCGADQGKYADLEEVSYSVKPNCSGHSIDLRVGCLNCSHRAITLKQQAYRHVDNIIFENGHIVDHFVDYWRKTGNQRMGFLYGRYEVCESVPLGIQAVVAAIYEPPQENSRNNVNLLENPFEQTVFEIAQELGLQRVGWIFTDLAVYDTLKGTVHNLRNKDTFFLSAQECCIAGKFQAKHPNPCKYSSQGKFGSKFVTVCVTGNDEHQIHLEGFQVSNQCMSLTKEGIIIPAKEAPELAYVKESTKGQPVPDVYFIDTDKYNNKVSKVANPFPVEYFLLDIPVAAPLEPIYTFHIPLRSFPIENRSNMTVHQSFCVLKRYLQQFKTDDFLQAVSDLHFLIFICSLDFVPIKEHIKPLIAAVTHLSKDQALKWRNSKPWTLLEQHLKEVVGENSDDEDIYDFSNENGMECSENGSNTSCSSVYSGLYSSDYSRDEHCDDEFQ